MYKKYNTAEFDGNDFGENIIDVIVDDDMFNKYIDYIIRDEIFISKEDFGDELMLERDNFTNKESIDIANHILKLDEIQEDLQQYKQNFSNSEYRNDFIEGLAECITAISEIKLQDRLYDIDINEYKQELIDRYTPDSNNDI